MPVQHSAYVHALLGIVHDLLFQIAPFTCKMVHPGERVEWQAPMQYSGSVYSLVNSSDIGNAIMTALLHVQDGAPWGAS